MHSTFFTLVTSSCSRIALASNGPWSSSSSPDEESDMRMRLRRAVALLGAPGGGSSITGSGSTRVRSMEDDATHSSSRRFLPL